MEESPISGQRKIQNIFSYLSKWGLVLIVIFSVCLLGFMVKVDYFSQENTVMSVECRGIFQHKNCNSDSVALFKVHTSIVNQMSQIIATLFVTVLVLNILNLYIKPKNKVLSDSDNIVVLPKVVFWTRIVFYLSIVFIVLDKLIWYLIPVDAPQYLKDMIVMKAAYHNIIMLLLVGLFILLYLESIRQLSHKYGFQSINKKFLFTLIVLIGLILINIFILDTPNSKPTNYTIYL